MRRLAARHPRRYPLLLDSAATGQLSAASVLLAAPSAALWLDRAGRIGAQGMTPEGGGFIDSLENWWRSERLPLADQPGFAPTAMFSALAPNTRIPAHTGSTNVRLLTHLPLILPGPARFRVGNETRPWKMGEAWVFDDTIEHEAWNDADELRVILIFDVWNPFVEEGERPLVNALLKARSDFFGS